MREEIIGQSFDEERALYNLSHADVIDCVFAGPADGESVLKEARDVSLENCSFSLRYPLWHVEGFKLHDSKMDELTRAAIWYAKDGIITDSMIVEVRKANPEIDAFLGFYQRDSIVIYEGEAYETETAKISWKDDNTLLINGTEYQIVFE